MESEKTASAIASADAAVGEALRAFAAGECVLVMDDAERENECDIFLHGSHCNERNMAFMIRHTTGIICAVADEKRLATFGLYPATHQSSNTDKNATNFYVSTDFLPGTSTGVSAADRATTIRAMVNLLHSPAEFSKPGHVFPLCARPAGLLEREGHTEAAYDMCRLAQLPTVAAIGELMDPETGRMLDFAQSQLFARTHGLVLVTVAQLKEAVQLRFARKEQTDVAQCRLPSRNLQGSQGVLRIFRCSGDVEVATLIKGEVGGKEKVPVRVHSECLTGDVFGSQRCDCGEQLQRFMTQVMGENECGVLMYVKGHEGRGMGLENKVKAYAVQDKLKLDTIDANLHVGFHTDTRDYAEIAEIIKDKLGIVSIVLYSNNPEKLASLAPLVARVEPLAVPANPHNQQYLLTKKNRLCHRTVMDTMRWDGQRLDGAQAPARVAVVAAKWNADFVEPLLSECLAELGKSKTEISVHRVPGALDLLAAARAILKQQTNSSPESSSRRPDAVVLLGVLIKGASDGYMAACNSLAAGVAQLNACAEFNVPVVSGVLMCQDEVQAEERCAGVHKLGAGFALEALEMVALTRSL